MWDVIKKIIGVVIILFLIILAVNYIKPSSSLPDLVGKTGFKGFPQYTKNTGWHIVDWSKPEKTIVNAPYPSTYAYQLDDTTGNRRGPYENVAYNARLIRVYTDGRSEIVIPDMRSRFSNILNKPNQMLVEYYFPQNSDVVYFNYKTTYETGVENRFHIYAYNTRTDELADLYVNRYLNKYAIKSPFNAYQMLAVNDGAYVYQRLYLIDVSADKAKQLTELLAGETLATTIPIIGRLPIADIYWINQSQVIYAVYEHVLKNGADTLVFKERRVMPI